MSSSYHRFGSLTSLGVGMLAAMLGMSDSALADRKGQGVKFCGMAYDTRTLAFSITDHSSSDNTPIGDVTFRKSCEGPVVGTLTAHITGNLHLHELSAECLSSGGFPGGCTPGTTVLASPSHTLLQSNGVSEVSFPVETVQWVWPRLAPGKWRYKVLPASFALVTVNYSSFKVEAYQQFVQ